MIHHEFEVGKLNHLGKMHVRGETLWHWNRPHVAAPLPAFAAAGPAAVDSVPYPKHADEVSSVTETRPCSWR